MKKFAFVAVLVAASLAMAATVEDFEGAWTGAGTVVADPDNAANNVLQLAGGQAVTFALAEAADGIVTFDVYDFGETSLTYGSRWGVVDSAAASLGATIINKSFLACSAGYGYSTETTMTGSWWSPAFFGGPRQVDALEDDGVTADGAWTTWSITVEDGVATIDAFGISQTGALADIATIWVSGGKTGDADMGVLFDNITFTAIPEPATLSMLVLGGLALIRRRR